MEMRAELRIDAQPGAAWAVVGEQFGQVGEWACPIADSSIEGRLAWGWSGPVTSRVSVQSVQV